MSEYVTREMKVSLQRDMLGDIAPELVEEIDRLEGIIKAVRGASALSRQDIDTTRPYYHSTKYVQGRVDGGDSALGRIEEVLRGA